MSQPKATYESQRRAIKYEKCEELTISVGPQKKKLQNDKPALICRVLYPNTMASRSKHNPNATFHGHFK
jgi:hypothetical protein